MKPGDLVRIIDWDPPHLQEYQPMGLVLSDPEVKPGGSTMVLVDWLESPDTTHYSVKRGVFYEYLSLYLVQG